MAQNSIPNDPLRVSPSDKISPESLNLRAKPKPVTHLNRRVLIGLSGTGVMLIFAATYYALHPPSFDQTENRELYNTTHREQPEQLAALPQTYKDYTTPNPGTPVLGAPLPGELGGALLAAEQRAGLEPFPLTTGPMPFQSDHLTDIERAERIPWPKESNRDVNPTSSFRFPSTHKVQSKQATLHKLNPIKIPSPPSQVWKV